MAEQTAILHRFVEVLNTGRADGVADLLAEDYVCNTTQAAQPGATA